MLDHKRNLRNPNKEGKIKLGTDKSVVGVGAVVSVEIEGKERVMAYAS